LLETGVPDDYIEASQHSLSAGKPEQFVLLDGPICLGHIFESLLHGLPGEERLTSHHVPALAVLRG